MGKAWKYFSIVMILALALSLGLVAVPMAGKAEADGLPCTCGNICVNTTGWWRDGGEFNATSTPIQDAVNNATGGEIICVKDGTYHENVVVNRSLTIRSQNGTANCTVNASVNTGHVFEVTADYVNITGFTVKNATATLKAGIYLNGREHCNISDNNVTNNEIGIYLYSSSNNTLTNNTANSNLYCGIILNSSSNNNTLTNNTANLNNLYGIYLLSSSNNTLTSNTANENIRYGIILTSSSSNTLMNNTANSNSEYGIYLSSLSNSNTLTSNTANSNKDRGIWLQSSSNTLTSNIANSNNRYGIILTSSSSNTLTNNTASNNTNYDFYSTANSHNNIAEDLTIASYPTTISFTYDNGVGLKGVTSPPLDPAGKRNIGKYVNATNVTPDSWLFLNVSYNDTDVTGVDEDSLRMWKCDGTNWTEVSGSGVNTANNYVFANITEFSIFAPLASAAAPVADFSASPTRGAVPH